MRILIIKLSALGDLFHALPAVHNLKVGLGAEIDWVTQKEYVDLVRCFTDVDRVITFYRNAFFVNLKPFLEELRTRDYDCIIDLQGLLKSAIVARLAHGKERIGPSFHREGSRLFYSAVAGERARNRHAVEENLDIVRHLGLDPVEPEFPVRFPATNLAEKRPRVAILPASRWHTKNWPPECFVHLVRRLQETEDISVFLIGGSKDVEVCGQIERELDGRVVNMAGKSTLVETGGILKEMDLLIANDSGPVHMATAVGTPVLAIFGPTDPARTGPYGDGHRVARTFLPCRPCFSRTCKRACRPKPLASAKPPAEPGRRRRDDVPCLSAVTPEMVSEIAITMLTRAVHE